MCSTASTCAERGTRVECYVIDHRVEAIFIRRNDLAEMSSVKNPDSPIRKDPKLEAVQV